MSFGDNKAAALYFERVIPVAFASLRGTKNGLHVNFPDPIPVEMAVKLIFGEEAPRHLIISYLDDHWSPFQKQIGPLITRKMASTDPAAYDEVRALYLSDAATPDGQTVRNKFRDFVRGLGIADASVLLPNESIGGSAPEIYPYIALLNLPMIDTSKASWEQIAEVRRNHTAVTKLRRLRLFFFENYSNKPASYVEDDLMKRLDDYDRVRKEFGFDTLFSALSVLMDAKTLQAAAVAALTGTLFQNAETGLTGAAAVELGKVALEIGKKAVQMKRFRDAHDLAYLIDLKHRLA